MGVDWGWDGNLHCHEFWPDPCEYWHVERFCGLAGLTELERDALEKASPLEATWVTELSRNHHSLFRYDDEVQALELTDCTGRVVRRYRLDAAAEAWLPIMETEGEPEGPERPAIGVR